MHIFNEIWSFVADSGGGGHHSLVDLKERLPFAVCAIEDGADDDVGKDPVHVLRRARDGA